jgi:hypothetical protein
MNIHANKIDKIMTAQIAKSFGLKLPVGRGFFVLPMETPG